MVQCNVARQGEKDILEDFDDKVLSLAIKTLWHLPENDMYQQTVMRLSPGSTRQGGRNGGLQCLALNH